MEYGFPGGLQQRIVMIGQQPVPYILHSKLQFFISCVMIFITSNMLNYFFCFVVYRVVYMEPNGMQVMMQPQQMQNFIPTGQPVRNSQH